MQENNRAGLSFYGKRNKAIYDLKRYASGIKSYYSAEELVGKTLLAIVNLPPRKMMGIDSCGMLLSAINEREGEEELNLLVLADKIPAGAKIY